jgi:hypothetical protein
MVVGKNKVWRGEGCFFVMCSLSTANINEKWEIVDFAAKKLKK